jgi:hypothetical protein
MALWAGRHPGREDLVTACRQCGWWIPVTVLRQGRGRCRYWCQRCGAVVAVATPVPLRRRADVRPAVTGESTKTSTTEQFSPDLATGAARSAPADPKLAEVMPPAMVRWQQARPGRRIDPDRLDKPRIYQLYRQWDAYLAEAGPDGAAALAADGETPPVTPLPAFSVVVGALHEGCYRLDRVVRVLLPDAPTPVQEALRERAAYARRWLHRQRASQCWIVRLCPDDGPARPDAEQVKAALQALQGGGRPDLAAGDAARAAAFGTTGGPSLAKLLAVYPTAEVVAALETYLDSGARPLRDDVLAALAGERDRSGADRPVTR